MINLKVPNSSQDFTPAVMSELLSERYPGTKVDSLQIVDSKSYGEGNASSSARIALELSYASNPGAVPSRLLVKMTLGAGWCGELHALYANEVDFYLRLRPEIDIETAHAFAARMDSASKQYVLVLEDLRARGVHFVSLVDEVSVSDVERVLDLLARMHAQFWSSHRFQSDLSWLQSYSAGAIRSLMDGLIRVGIEGEIAKSIYKPELIGAMGTSIESLWADLAKLHRHRERLPQTLLHGDPHIGNIYRARDGALGLYDWALSVRGHAIHDVAYHITTALPVKVRRLEERNLLKSYIDRLSSYGVTGLDEKELWFEYRLAPVWGTALGWLGTPIENYGWEGNVLMNLRFYAAYVDHETRNLMNSLDGET